MKKLLSLLLALTMSASFAACGNDAAQSSQAQSSENTDAASSEADTEYTEITLKFGTASAESTLTTQTFIEFGKRLNEASGGKVNVEVYASGVLGNTTEMAQGAQMGTIDLGVLQPGGLADMGAKRMNLLTLPYLFTSREQYYNTLMGDIGQDILQDLTDNVQGLRGFGFLPDGARCYFTNGKGIRNINDIKGMKLRIQPYAVDNATAEALGFSPTPTAFSELYSALQTGVVDGAENPLSGIDGNALYEVSEYLVLDNHTYNIPVLYFSEMTWNKLNKNTQDLLNATWKETVEEFFEPIFTDYEKELLTTFQEKGVTVIEQLEDLDKWVEAVAPVWKEYGADVQDLIDRVEALK